MNCCVAKHNISGFIVCIKWMIDLTSKYFDRIERVIQIQLYEQNAITMWCNDIGIDFLSLGRLGVLNFQIPSLLNAFALNEK